MNETYPTPAGDVSARIARLLVYPVKSCAGVEVQAAVLTATGLALVQPQLLDNELVLKAPGWAAR